MPAPGGAGGNWQDVTRTFKYVRPLLERLRAQELRQTLQERETGVTTTARVRLPESSRGIPGKSGPKEYPTTQEGALFTSRGNHTERRTHRERSRET